MSKRLILPGDPEFYATLHGNLPPNWREVASHHSGDFCLVARAGSGLLEAVSSDEAVEYLEGGEYDLVLDEQEEEEWLIPDMELDIDF